MPVRKQRRSPKEYGVEDEAGNRLIEPSATTKAAARIAAARLAERRGESVYVFEVGEDSDGTRIVVDREEISPPAESPKSKAQIKREVDEILASKPRAPAQFTSKAVVAQMIGRRVKSGWHGLVDGEIIQWEPFGAGGTDVLVKDVASGHLSWYASHGLTPIDGRGPLPSRSEVRRIREAEMATSMKKIGERWAKEPPPPRIRR